MNGRYLSLLAVLALLVYISLASMFAVVSEDLGYAPPATRTPYPTFTPTFPPPTVPGRPTATATRVLPAGGSGATAGRQAAAGRS
jgi:hypothetical protein